MEKIDRIAAVLEEMALFLELKNENQFKVRAHQNAARLVDSWGSSPEELLEASGAGKVAGIGSGLAEKIAVIAATGTHPELETLRKAFPETLPELFRVPGLGPKKVKVLWEKLRIASLAELAVACQSHKVAALDGFGEKSEAKFLEGIERIKKYAESFRLGEVLPLAEDLVERLRKIQGVLKADFAGSVRRSKEIVGDLDFVVAAAKGHAVIEQFTKFPEVIKVTGQGETKASVVLKSGIAADLRVVAPEEFAAALNYFTGSKAHNTRVRGIAQEKGLKLNEYGLFKGEKAKKIGTEAELYSALGMAFVPPELREDMGEIEEASRCFEKSEELPQLVRAEDLRGVIHLHTTYSDGRNSLREMAEAAQARGYEYMVVTDHSRSAAYAGGLSIEKVRQQRREVDKLNDELAPFRIFRGIESDILADGSLDYPDAVLEEFEVVIASIHSGFTMSEKEMTERIIKAIRHPATRIVGHLTGRLLLEREGYAVNIPEVIQAAAKADVAIELNANPYRLDLDWRFHRFARERGVSIPISPDAHSVEGFDDVRFGVGIARKGGCQPKDVLNTRPLAQFLRWVERR